MTENKYHFGREIIYNLRSCHAISNEVYLHWLDKLNEEEKLSLCDVGISNRQELTYLKDKYEVNWLINNTYQVERNGQCIYQDTKDGCNEYLKGLLGY